MSAGADDTWAYVVTLPPSVPKLEWKPLLDDSTWSRGPNYVALRGQTVDVYPHFYNGAGTVSKLFTSFHSNLLGNDRAVWLYLPASYSENTRATYPVLYMHDGQNLFDPSAPWGGWHVGDTLNAAGEDGSIRELIVIGPENAGTKREWEYTPDYDKSEKDGGGGDLYLRFLLEELKPQVDAMLRTRAGRSTTGVLGSSLGGLISAYAGVTKASSFGIVGAMSPSTWWNNDVIVSDVQGSVAPRPDRVYVDYGDPDDGGEDTILLVQAYQSIGYVEGSNFHAYVQPGGLHQENYWAQRLPGALQFLWGPRVP
jgi:predicted alpha/beta superfamily hydrolase